MEASLHFENPARMEPTHRIGPFASKPTTDSAVVVVQRTQQWRPTVSRVSA